MSEADCIALLGGWEGYTVVRAERRVGTAQQPRGQVVITLEPAPGPHRCSGCGRASEALHDVTVRWVRDLPLLDAATWLIVPRIRVACPGCGPKLEALSWLAPYARVTRRLAEQVARLCAVLPIKHVAAFFGLGWETVKAIDAAHLEATLGPINLTDVRVIAMDEFAIQKGHRYATVVVEPLRKRVLWVGRGRSRETVRAFFELLGPAGRQRLEAIVMDMDTAFTAEAQAQCPHAPIVYDLFHVVAKYGREVIDRVRVDAANRLRHDRPARHVLKGARWLLLRNRCNLRSRAERVRLRDLLAANRPLLTVYVLKDDLKQLWAYRYPAAAERFFRHWYRRAISSRLAPLKKFARALKRLLPGILAHCRWPLHTSLLEGINNKIKVLKRMAYGFRDDAYFFLKIRAAFPGLP